MGRGGSLPVAMQYALAVERGDVVACKWLNLAVQRHLRDLETAHERGLYFDEAAAQRVLDFFEFLRHSKGEWAGKTFELEPWQQFYLWVLFGWKRADGTRRFRVAYKEVARKNGKSTEASGVGLYLLDADGEPGAECYTAATKRDQARITHSEATRMVKSSPFLRRRLHTYKDNISCLETNSKFEPLGRDSDSMDGLHVHGAIIDEIHAHKTRDVWDVIETATGARRQPLIYGITTAGFDRHSLCYQLHEYLQRVLEGVVEDDAFFGVIYTLDEGDDWEDESCWVKANPNLGVSVKLEDLRAKAARAREMPSALNAFLRLHLNVWTQAETRWMPADKWRACGGEVDPEKLRGRVCYGGLDLSRTTDITAFVLVFPPEAEGEPYRVLPRFWVPDEAIHLRSRRDRVPYESWLRAGLIEATPGPSIDYAHVIAQIEQDARDYALELVAFDRWGAAQISQQLDDIGIELVEFGQGYASMSAPMKELERLVLRRELAHGGNPVLAWMADNLVARSDPAGNLKPDKDKSIDRIDGMVALLMGLDLAVRMDGGHSVYEERGPLVC